MEVWREDGSSGCRAARCRFGDIGWVVADGHMIARDEPISQYASCRYPHAMQAVDANRRGSISIRIGMSGILSPLHDFLYEAPLALRDPVARARWPGTDRALTYLTSGEPLSRLKLESRPAKPGAVPCPPNVRSSDQRGQDSGCIVKALPPRADKSSSTSSRGGHLCSSAPRT